jgi:hypothetical protein
MLEDGRGMEETPLKLVIYVVITVIILSFLASGFRNAIPRMEEAALEKQLGEIKASIEAMQYEYARNLSDPLALEGSMRSFRVKISENIEYISYGVDPDPDNDGIIGNTPSALITGDHENFIFYKLRGWGKQRMPVDGARFREGEKINGRWNLSQEGVVIRPLDSEISFELVFDPSTGKKYVISHFSDGFELLLVPPLVITGIDADDTSQSKSDIFLRKVEGSPIPLKDAKAVLYINGEKYEHEVFSLHAPTFNFGPHDGYQYIGGPAFSGDHWKAGEEGVINVANGRIREGDHVSIRIIETSSGKLIADAEAVA